MGDKDLMAQQEARDAVEAAHRAFLTVAKFDQEQIDRICAAMAKAVLADAERLGLLAHEETGFGKAEDKREKNRFAAEDVWNYFRGLKTVGVIKESESVVEIASPRGVVAAIIPSTNPTSTAIFKIIIAIKSRNSIVLSPHPSAARCIAETARVMRDAAIQNGLPGEAIYCIQNSTIEATEALMQHRLGSCGLLFRKARVWRRPRKCAGVHRAVGECRKGGCGHFDRDVLRQRHDLRF